MPRGTARVRPPMGFFQEDDLSEPHPIDTKTAIAYAGLAAADPKAPFELRAMGWRVWLGQFIGVTAAFYLVDPLRLREGGLDDWYLDPVYNPTRRPLEKQIGKAKKSAHDWWHAPFGFEEMPTIWEFW